MTKGVLSTFTAGVWFIHGLPPSLANKLIRDLAIDTEDPVTVKYQTELEHIMKQAASDNTIQRMNAARASSQLPTEVVGQIAGQLEPTVSRMKEQRFMEPVVRPAESASVPNAAI